MSEYEGILDSLEEVHKKLDRFLSSREFVFKNKTIDQEELLEEPKETIMTEEVECDKDLSGVVLLKETPLAFLAFKKNMQVWVAKSHLEGEYVVGNTYDLKVKEKSKWVLGKLDWKPFTVVKG